MALRTKRKNNKQKARFTITDINNQEFRKFLKKFRNSIYLCYESKQVHNETTEDYFFLIKHITKVIKSKRHIIICSNFVKLGLNKKIRHVNKTIGHVNEAIQSLELELNNEMTTCVDKDKQILSVYDIKGEENTSGISENKEKARDGYVRIYECGKHLLTPTSERAFAAQEISISQIK